MKNVFVVLALVALVVAIFAAPAAANVRHQAPKCELGVCTPAIVITGVPPVVAAKPAPPPAVVVCCCANKGICACCIKERRERRHAAHEACKVCVPAAPKTCAPAACAPVACKEKHVACHHPARRALHWLLHPRHCR